MVQTRLTFGRNLSAAPPPQYSAIFSPFHLTFGQGSHLFHPEFWPGAL